MRRKIVAGNWKMNITCQEGEALVNVLIAAKNEIPSDVDLIVAPPFTHIYSITKLLSETKIDVSAQNCAAEEQGAYTGEVSAKMIAAIGAKYCIIGHSERRQYYGETNSILLQKVRQALKVGLQPIFCVGEILAEREENRHFGVVKTQLEEVVLQLSSSDFEKIIIAYEPVWAIGTGKTATSQQAQEIHAFIREILTKKFGTSANNTPILYGGSCKPSNAKEIFAQPDVDGGLIGGASLVVEDFLTIAKSF